MDLRIEIQKLAIWYIPIALLSILVSSWYGGVLREAYLDGDVSPASVAMTLSNISTALAFSVRLVVAIWLYMMVSKSKGNKYIWFMFGLVANLLALIIFICISIYEQNASNKSSNLTGAENAPSS